MFHPECRLLLSKVRKRTCAVKEKGMPFNPDIS
jgi:hypothetical protein